MVINRVIYNEYISNKLLWKKIPHFKSFCQVVFWVWFSRATEHNSPYQSQSTHVQDIVYTGKGYYIHTWPMADLSLVWFECGRQGGRIITFIAIVADSFVFGLAVILQTDLKKFEIVECCSTFFISIPPPPLPQKIAIYPVISSYIYICIYALWPANFPIPSSPWRLLLHPAAWNTVSELCIIFCNLQCIEINAIYLIYNFLFVT